jgi:2-methylisocitrate lyase-like PEP mutase family enzyme
MSRTTNKAGFHAFKAMHETGLLRLANAWDAGSARLIESLGARAIATTSAGMAWAAGYADGNRMPRDLVLASADRIARVIKVPLSVDIEGGYSSDPQETGELAVRLADVGVVGVNIEDGAEPAALLARKIEAVKAALAKADVEIFVNARTDVYLAGLVEPSKRVDEVLRRATLYEAAGADGLFVPAILALTEIGEITKASKLPLNVLSRDGLPAPRELEDAGVRRLSAGSGISARVWAQAETAARQFLDEGRLTGVSKVYGDLQQLFM